MRCGACPATLLCWTSNVATDAEGPRPVVLECERCHSVVILTSERGVRSYRETTDPRDLCAEKYVHWYCVTKCEMYLNRQPPYETPLYVAHDPCPRCNPRRYVRKKGYEEHDCTFVLEDCVFQRKKIKGVLILKQLPEGSTLERWHRVQKDLSLALRS